MSAVVAGLTEGDEVLIIVIPRKTLTVRYSIEVVLAVMNLQVFR